MPRRTDAETAAETAEAAVEVPTNEEEALVELELADPDADMVAEGDPEARPDIRFDPDRRRYYRLGPDRQRIYLDLPAGCEYDENGAPVPVEG